MRHTSARALLLSTALTAAAFAAHAQTAPAAPLNGETQTQANAKPGLQLEEVVVTAQSRSTTKMKSSVSVSTLGGEQIRQLQPQSTSDILRDVPGIRAESSGGEGNANINVRGLPVASGGAKFVQFQEDGLPVLDFGDIAFATADEFFRIDNNVARLEVVRGGSASTATSNAPGAIFNFISKDGSVQGGSVGVTEGLGFDRTRVDFDYGMPVSPDWKFHLGGFYRVGEGEKSIGYTAYDGGQIKGNVTHTFANGDGSLRLNFGYLNDRAPAYLPVPMSITGSNRNPNVSSLPNFNATMGALQTPYLKRDLSLDQNNNPEVTEVTDGYHTEVGSVGGLLTYDLGGGFHVEDRVRYAGNSGDFVGEYPASVDTAQNLADAIGGAGSTLRYANGPYAGRVADAATVGGNGLAVKTGLFDVKLNNFDNFTNILALRKDIDAGDAGSGFVNVSYFHSHQNIVMDWHWNTYLQEAIGSRSALLNVYNAAGALQTDNGLVTYSDPFYPAPPAQQIGSCCTRYFNTHYTIDAPVLGFGWTYGNVRFDGSLRYDIDSANGSYDLATGLGVVDVNDNGILSVPETKVRIFLPNASQPVDYTKRYLSYSFGANYLVNRDLSIFARGSRGGRFNADRVLFGGGVQPDGGISQAAAVNIVDQQEVGAKWRVEGLSLFLTGFHATTAESTNDITTAGVTEISRDYEAYGAELEFGYSRDIFNISGGVTYTHARITADAITPGDVGHVPQRQADFIYQMTPSISWKQYGVGVNIIGTTDSYADSTANGLVMPGYVELNAFATYDVTPHIRVQLNGLNLTDTIGLTEIDGNAASVTPNGLNSARSILGRTVTGTLRYTF